MPRFHPQPWIRAIVPALALACAGPRAARAQGHEFQDDVRWSTGYTLVVLDAGADLRTATRLVQARGGTVALELPPRILTGWIPPALDATLVGHAGIRAICRDPAALPADLTAAPGVRGALRFFTRAARGTLELSAAESAAPTGAPHKTPAAEFPAAGLAGTDLVPGAGFAAGPGVLLPDAFDRPFVSEAEILANLQGRGIDVRKAGGAAALAANSETMTGTISVALFFVESDGSGADANAIDWTSVAE